MILVVGGAGYIGSHVVKQLIQTEEVIVLDNLSTGHREALDKRAVLIEGDLRDDLLLQQVFEMYPIEAVMHFAACSLVEESVRCPQKYYENNVYATLQLLKVMLMHNVKKFIFSSTAAVYGLSQNEPLSETNRTNPINPYGHSKLMIEQILHDYAKAYDMQCTVLRYFNAAGANALEQIGESHTPESHLIPLLLQHLNGERASFSIFGDDYATKDGTCVRDFVHVDDIARAHILALEALAIEPDAFTIFNLGNERGYSVMEVVELCEQVTGKKTNLYIEKRRAGDPSVLIASSQKIKKQLGWQAERDLQSIIRDAWQWHQHPIY